MLIILIIGLIAGPAVSLYGSPTVSQVTADLCAPSFFPKITILTYFFALSHAPPPEVIDIATNKPVTIVPSNIALTVTKAGPDSAIM